MDKYNTLKSAISTRLKQLRETEATNMDSDVVKLSQGGRITLEGIQELIHTIDKLE